MVEERRKADGNSGQHILTIMCELFSTTSSSVHAKKSYASVYFISIYYNNSNLDLIFVKYIISQSSCVRVCKFNMYIMCAIYTSSGKQMILI